MSITVEEVTRDLTLLLMYLNSWEDGPYGVRRCWKGFDSIFWMSLPSRD